MFLEARMSNTKAGPMLGFNATNLHQASPELLATQHKSWSEDFIQYD